MATANKVQTAAFKNLSLNTHAHNSSVLQILSLTSFDLDVNFTRITNSDFRSSTFLFYSAKLFLD